MNLGTYINYTYITCLCINLLRQVFTVCIATFFVNSSLLDCITIIPTRLIMIRFGPMHYEYYSVFVFFPHFPLSLLYDSSRSSVISLHFPLSLPLSIFLDSSPRHQVSELDSTSWEPAGEQQGYRNWGGSCNVSDGVGRQAK